MEATYISNNSFSIAGLRTEDFITGRRLKLDCGIDGVKYASITSSVFTTVTTIVINETSLTSNLTTVMYSPVKPGTQGNLPDHTHSASEGDGGYIEPPIVSFTGLIDTPTTYSGSGGLYAQSTGSGIVWAAVESGSSNVETFLDLTDTPTTYSGGQYLRTTTSGIEAIDGIIITAPNESEWLIQVTNSGTLYTTGI